MLSGISRFGRSRGSLRSISLLQAEYRRLDCALLARDLEIAAIDHDQSKARVERFAARRAACRRQLED